MNFTDIEKQTRIRFPEWDSAALGFCPLEKGGSGRIFIRVEKEPGGESLIAMHFTNERPDNARFASITDFLLAQQITVPRILARQEDLGLLWVEDLGEIDLHDAAQNDWDSVRRPRYESALQSVFRLHRISEEEPPVNIPEMEPGFDSGLYDWEQGYFFQHFVKNFAGPEGEALQDSDALTGMAKGLAEEPRCLVHRDFQSTNIMLRDGLSYLIDYQGLRWGLAEYDLASLIYDPYCPFTEDQQESLATFYYSLKQSAGDLEDYETFRQRLAHCAVQRLMQALGAYGFLGLVKGKREFLHHIPVAVDRLRNIAVDQGYLPELAPCLRLRD